MSDDWRAIKQEARDIVHGTFGYSCIYSDDTVTIPDCTARHHHKTAYIGDGDEFAPGLLSELNRVIIDLRQVPNPKYLGTLTFLNGLVLTIQNVTDQEENFVMCEVKK